MMSRHRVCTTRGARWRSSANTALGQRQVEGFGGARQALSALQTTYTIRRSLQESMSDRNT